jgi:glycosyltransferase involved in cell wall biosynthesis
MAARNAAPTIAGAIRSIQAQTETSWELLCVDDGSTDDTAAIVAELAEADPRVTLISIGHRGRGGARNVALKTAVGAYVAVCDADDLSRPDRFAVQRAFLDEHPDVFAVGGGLAPFVDDAERDRLGERHWPSTPDGIARRFSQLRMGMPHPAVMLRTAELERVGLYDESLDRCQDLDLFLRAHRLGLRFANLEQVLVDYRQDGRVQSFDYYRDNAIHHAEVVRKHVSGPAALRPFALVHRLGPLALRPRYALHRLKRRRSEGKL